MSSDLSTHGLLRKADREYDASQLQGSKKRVPADRLVIFPCKNPHRLGLSSFPVMFFLTVLEGAYIIWIALLYIQFEFGHYSIFHSR
jgi:hypothetical protein